jgi:nicotinate-nucleotide adenylyltransferase
VPVYEHAFHKALAPFEHRVAMCRSCFAALGAVEVSDVEAALPRPSYTERTLERLAQGSPGARLRFVMGSDALSDTDKWHDYRRVVELAPPFVLARRGHERPELGPAVLPDVSSSRVRELFARGASDRAARRELEALVPSAVIAYADARGLYR